MRFYETPEYLMLLRMAKHFRCSVTAAIRTTTPVPSATLVLGSERRGMGMLISRISFKNVNHRPSSSFG